MGQVQSQEEGLSKQIIQGELEVPICDINVSQVQVLSEGGGTDTVMVFAELLRQAGKPSTPIVAKMWVGPTSPAPFCPDMAGLDYEARVYHYVTENLLPEAPFFIPFISFGVCTLPKMQQQFGKEVGDQVVDLQGMVKSNAKRKILAPQIEEIRSTTTGIERSRALRALRAQPVPMTEGCISDSIHILITKRGGSSFSGWIRTTPAEEDLRQVLLMILLALRIMHAHQVTHNDLHMANVLVAVDQPPIQLGGFSFTTSYRPLLFDWDRAYVEQLGPNPFLTPELCGRTGACNKDNTSRDLYTFFCKLSGVISGYTRTRTFVQKYFQCDDPGSVSIDALIHDPYFLP